MTVNAQISSRPNDVPGHGTTRPRSLATRGLILLAGLAAALGLFSSAARADVNTSNSTWASAALSNCTIYAGDLWNSGSYAIGDTTVRCGSHHNLLVYTELYYNGVRVAYSPYAYYGNALYVHDVPTHTAPCVAPGGLWTTRSWVSIDGGAWHYKDSPSKPFSAAC
jgi:hypothetical protein